MEEYVFAFDSEKNALLKIKRDICFRDVIPFLEQRKWLAVLSHPNTVRYPHQGVYIVLLREEVYAVPFVVDTDKKTIFLKTIYPSRKYRKIYGIKKL